MKTWVLTFIALATAGIAGGGCYSFRGGVADAAAPTDLSDGDGTGDRTTATTEHGPVESGPSVDASDGAMPDADAGPSPPDADGPDIADAGTLLADGAELDVADVGAAPPDVDRGDAAGFDASRVDRPDVSTTEVDAAPATDATVAADGGPPMCPAGQARCGERCVDTAVSPGHCGACGASCPARANATPACVAGICRFVCRAGYEDCDGVVGNGCEASLASAESCGACGNRCLEPTPVCQETAGRYACASGCTGVTGTRCSMSCVDIRSDLRHCGGCDRVCPVPAGGNATCVAGTCGLACESGRHLCGMVCADDAAVETCGTRCEPCPARANATTTCRGGTCGFTCLEGYVDCDGDPGSGCEADIRTSAADCGACGNRCPTGVGCAAGSCAPFVSVAAGNRHTCAVRSDGTVWCWGRNNEQQLGDGTSVSRRRPVRVVGIATAVAVSVGSGHSCALLRDETVACWGWGGNGELGDGMRTGRATAGIVPGLAGVQVISAGLAHVCALLRGGSIRCWGANNNGQVGDGTNANSRPGPVAVAGVSRATNVSAGSSHTCALLDDGSLRCWGYGAHGQLGDGMTTPVRTMPVTPLLSDAIELSSGEFHTCALTRDLRAWCWGWNAYGEVGATGEDLATPLVLSSLNAPSRVDAGLNSTCVVASRRVLCWGANASGQLGDGTTTSRSTPAPVAAGVDLSSVAVGGFHACALDPQGALYCWGLNDSGQLGEGTTMNRTVPTRIEIP